MIESLFGCFKYNSGGNLSPVNYHNCVAILVIADACNSREEYRGVKCDHKGILVKKKYYRKLIIVLSLWCSCGMCVCVHYDAAIGLSSSLSISVTAEFFPFWSKCI